jgi:hypothetical protein
LISLALFKVSWAGKTDPYVQKWTGTSLSFLSLPLELSENRSLSRTGKKHGAIGTYFALNTIRHAPGAPLNDENRVFQGFAFTIHYLLFTIQ